MILVPKLPGFDFIVDVSGLKIFIMSRAFEYLFYFRCACQPYKTFRRRVAHFIFLFAIEQLGNSKAPLQLGAQRLQR